MSTETLTPETQTVHTITPEALALQESQAATYRKPRIVRNFSIEPGADEKSQFFVGLSFDEIALQLRIYTGNWPKRIGDDLFVLSEKNEVQWIREPAELVGWLGTKFIQLDFRANSGHKYTCLPTKTELLDYLRRTVDRYDDVFHLPHYPRFEAAFYTPEVERYAPRRTGLFDDFVDLFSPYAPADKVLIAAFFATPFWNCEPGSRPLFVIEGPPDDPDGGVGVGKSVLVDACAMLSGLDGSGYIDGPDDKFNPDELKKRIINDFSDARIVRYDNIKKTSLSSGVLESLITAPAISGHALHKGHRTKPNRFTYVLTFNDASLSKDLASRAVRIRLSRPNDYDVAWKRDLFKLIRKKRAEIVSDLLWRLGQPGDHFPSQFRFGEWQTDVLNKFTAGKDLSGHLTEARAELNSEVDELDEIEGAIANRLRAYHFQTEVGVGGRFDPEVHGMFIPNNLLQDWLRRDLSRWFGDIAHIKHRVKRSTLLRDGRIRPNIRGLLWSPDGTDFGFVPPADPGIKEIRGAPRKVSPPK